MNTNKKHRRPAGFVVKKASDDRAFTRLELLFCILGAVLLLGVALPMMAGNNPRSELAACMNNLRRIGIGMNAWASDHGDRNVWWTPRAAAGSQVNPKNGNGWVEFAYASNYLNTPKILICPGDPARFLATHWGGGPGGLLESTHRDNAVSYFVGLHAVADNPESWLSGDKNLKFNSSGQSCTTGIQNAWTLSTTQITGWTNNIHGLKGNLLMNSGQVQTVDNAGFGEALLKHNDTLESETRNVHLLPSF
jgi:hypothetical protein